ncbi:hypothetical protein DPMN_101899 [Dreissena polymorpha]|uniref:Uncharacterized protein n=1 Tax=Dreissena polymorpha TaxID=45954 RepID=A0A9D4R9H3_DREPO|nr:hypothetical protein DPMN_101899 [Dreissena polymorpha]
MIVLSAHVSLNAQPLAQIHLTSPRDAEEIVAYKLALIPECKCQAHVQYVGTAEETRPKLRRLEEAVRH